MVYTVWNETYHYGRHDDFLDRGLTFDGCCHRRCSLYITISPTDMRYNGAQITGVLTLPDSSNITDSMTLNIQGTLYSGTLKVFHVLFSRNLLGDYIRLLFFSLAMYSMGKGPLVY